MASVAITSSASAVSISITGYGKNSDNSDFQAYANDIIEWDGTNWNVIFNSTTTDTVTYITNSFTGIQYKWENEVWSKSYEGIYDKSLWRLIL
jgi:hypothetical protein